MAQFNTIAWKHGQLVLLDQRALPDHETYVHCNTWSEVADAISNMVVRGAPAIGITAAYGVAMGVRDCSAGSDSPALNQEFMAVFDGLAATRPTAVNLFWALERMKQCLFDIGPHDVAWEALLDEARRIHSEDAEMCSAMGVHGAALLPDGARILTHCNTGALATGGDGTALAVIRAGWRAGKVKMVYADETRPFLQGSRLTAWELHRDGIPVRVITDNMAAHFMKCDRIDGVVVGTDRIAANGDIANKIGTYGLAVLCRAHGIPFWVVGPTSTIDLATFTGDEIEIELRNEREVTHVGDTRIVPRGVSVENPAFDITPAEFVTAIVTECGVIEAPFENSLHEHVQLAKTAPTEALVTK